MLTKEVSHLRQYENTERSKKTEKERPQREADYEAGE
jgi:hypothetical protein